MDAHTHKTVVRTGAIGAAHFAQPFQSKPFSSLYLGYVTAFLAVAALESTVAWTLAEQGASEATVSLVYTANSLPVMVLVFAGGILSDVLDKWTALLLAQVWAGLVALLMALLLAFSEPSAAVLIGLTACFAISTALRLPILNAMVPMTIPAQQMANAMTLFGMAMSLTRIVGPLIALAILALFGTSAVFFFIAFLSACVIFTSRGLAGAPRQAVKMMPALRVGFSEGVSYAWRTPELLRSLRSGFLYYAMCAGTFALAPLHAAEVFGKESFVFLSTIVASGCGAVLAGVIRPYLGALKRFADPLRVGSLLCVIGGLIVILAPNLPTLWVGVVLHGGSWLFGMSSLTTRAQLFLSDEVRARGLALVQMACVGGVALGAALWGVAAMSSSITLAIAISSGLMFAYFGARELWRAHENL